MVDPLRRTIDSLHRAYDKKAGELSEVVGAMLESNRTTGEIPDEQLELHDELLIELLDIGRALDPLVGRPLRGDA